MGFRQKLRLKQEIENLSAFKVADINFVFDNAEVIEILKVRGLCIKTSNWDKLKLMEIRLEEVMQRDMYKLTIPIQAFVTMETEDGYNAMMKDKHFDLLGSTSTVIQATEPTNIVWENR